MKIEPRTKVDEFVELLVERVAEGPARSALVIREVSVGGRWRVTAKIELAPVPLKRRFAGLNCVVGTMLPQTISDADACPIHADAIKASCRAVRDLESTAAKLGLAIDVKTTLSDLMRHPMPAGRPGRQPARRGHGSN